MYEFSGKAKDEMAVEVARFMAVDTWVHCMWSWAEGDRWVVLSGGSNLIDQRQDERD